MIGSLLLFRPAGSGPTTRLPRAALVWRPAIVVALLWATLFGSVEFASAHAFLDRSDPTSNAILPTPPQTVTMHFTEPLERTYTRADLYDQAGAQIAGTSFQFLDNDRYSLILVLPLDLPNGTYSVVWRTLSAADGHSAQGYFAFTIGTQSDVATVLPPASSSVSGPPQWLKTLSRWVPYLGLALAVAVWPIWLLVLRPGISPAWQAGPALTRRVRRLAALGIGVAFVGNVFALLVQADAANETGLVDATRTTLADTRYGELWLYRIMALFAFGLALTFCAWWWPRRRAPIAAATLVLAAVLPVPFALISHASAATTGKNAAVAFDVVHLLGASLWIGGLFVLVGALLPTLRDLTPAGRRIVLARTIPRFSAVALTAWGVLAITGLYSAWLQVGNLDGLLDTAYGQSLTAKLLLLVPLLALSAFNLLKVSRAVKRTADPQTGSRWSRRFALAVGAEAILVVAVLLVVGRLTSQPPARETLAREAGQITLDLEADGRTGSLSIAPAVAGPNHYRLDLGGDTIPLGADALLRLTAPSVQTGQKEVLLSRVGGNSFEAHGSELSLTGDWEIDVVVRKIGEFQWQDSTTAMVRSPGAAPALARPAWRFDTAAGVAGLVLLIAGLTGLSLAWYAGRTPLRKESAGLGVVSLALSAVLLLQGRTPVGGSAVALTAKNPIAADQTSITRGKEVYTNNCAVCHGVTGRGDGPAGANLDPPYPPPADFLTSHARAHYDGEFFNWVKFGKVNTAMPAWGDELTDIDIWHVINYIRWMQQNPDQIEAGPVASPAATPGP